MSAIEYTVSVAVLLGFTVNPNSLAKGLASYISPDLVATDNSLPVMASSPPSPIFVKVSFVIASTESMNVSSILSIYLVEVC